MGNLKHTQMKVWKDLWTGDEMLSDSYPMKMLYEDACIEVKAKMVQKGSDFVAIAADDEAGDEEGESVINLVDAHKLQELELSKKNAMQMIKALMKKTAAYLKENGGEDRVKPFMQGATQLVKFIMGKFDEMQIFMGEGEEAADNSLCFAYTKDGETEPTFLYFADTMKEE